MIPNYSEKTTATSISRGMIKEETNMREVVKTFKRKNLFIVSLFISVIAFVFAPFAPATAAKAEGEIPDGETSVEGVFEMEKDYCVGLRLDENGGMRFIAKMDETVKNHIVNDDSVTLKFVIAPKDFMDEVTDENYYGMTKKIVVNVDESKIFQVGDYYYANGCVTNMQEANYKRNYTAVAVILNGETVERTTPYCGGELYGNYYDVANQAILYNENGVDYAKTMLGLTTYDWLGSKDYPIKGGAEEYNSYKSKADGGIALKNKYVSFGLVNNDGVTAEGDSLTFTDGGNSGDYGTQKILRGGNTANSEGFVLKYTTTVANGVVNGGVYFEMAQDGITYKYSMFIINDTKGAMVQLIEYNEKENTSTYYNFNNVFSSKIEDGDIKVTIICKRNFNNTSNRTCFSVVLNEGGEGKKVRLYEGWSSATNTGAQPVLYKKYVAQDYKFGLVAYPNTSATFKDVSFALGDDVADKTFTDYNIFPTN